MTTPDKVTADFSPSTLTLLSDVLVAQTLPVALPDFATEAARWAIAKSELASAVAAIIPPADQSNGNGSPDGA